jgi:DNA-binding CsgD family transcriptional regulator
VLAAKGSILPCQTPRDRVPKLELPQRNCLTTREREIVQLLAEGKSSKDVAVALGISVKTAETHRANIMRKLELHSVSELVRYAIKNQIIEALTLCDPGSPRPNPADLRPLKQFTRRPRAILALRLDEDIALCPAF